VSRVVIASFASTSCAYCAKEVRALCQTTLAYPFERLCQGGGPADLQKNASTIAGVCVVDVCEK
jgi:hypothetical protein